MKSKTILILKCSTWPRICRRYATSNPLKEQLSSVMLKSLRLKARTSFSLWLRDWNTAFQRPQKIFLTPITAILTGRRLQRGIRGGKRQQCSSVPSILSRVVTWPKASSPVVKFIVQVEGKRKFRKKHTRLQRNTSQKPTQSLPRRWQYRFRSKMTGNKLYALSRLLKRTRTNYAVQDSLKGLKLCACTLNWHLFFVWQSQARQIVLTVIRRWILALQACDKGGRPPLRRSRTMKTIRSRFYLAARNHR